MRGAAISALKILGFLGVWAMLIAAVVMIAIVRGGENWFANAGWRIWVEVGGAVAVLAALVFMARIVDRRGWGTLGFDPTRLVDLLTGTVLGAAIMAAPLLLLVAIGAARVAPDVGDLTAQALGLALMLCFFNVVTQEALVRSYIFQELWKKYGAALAISVTTAIFLALHAAPIMQGTAGLIAGANILIASIMLGLAYVRSGALWLPIGIHLGWNALQGPLLGINVTGMDLGMGAWLVFEFPGDPLLTGGAMGVEGGLAGLLGPVIGLAAVALLWKRRSAE